MLSDQRTRCRNTRAFVFSNALLAAFLKKGSLTGSASGIQRDGTCQILAMVPLSDRRDGPPGWLREEGRAYYGRGSWPSPESIGVAGYTLMASAMMAIEHFNARNHSIVSALSSSEYQTCNITLPLPTFVDSGYDNLMAFNSVSDAPESICAVIGPEASGPTTAVSLATARRGIPQLSYGALDERIIDMNAFPTVVRTVPDMHAFATMSLEYLLREGKERKFFGLIHDQLDYGEQFEHSIFEEMGHYEVNLVHDNLSYEDPDSIYNAMKTVSKGGYHTIVLSTDDPAFLEHVAMAADELGLLGEEWFYIITGDALPTAYLDALQNRPGSPLDQLLDGAAVIRIIDPFLAQKDENDAFLKSWRSLDDDFRVQVNSLHPFNDAQDLPEYFLAHEGFFQDTHFMPTHLASFLYDSIMLTGMSACQLYHKISLRERYNNMSQVPGVEDKASTRETDEETRKRQNMKDGENRRLDYDPPQNPEQLENGGTAKQPQHVQEMLGMSFHGASGRVIFEKGTNTRSPLGTLFGAYNIRPREMDKKNGLRRYNAILTSIRDGDSPWTDIHGTRFEFHGGQTDMPMPLRTVVDENYLSPALHIAGLTSVGLALFIAITSGILVWFLRKKKIMKAAQPEFLYLVCFGSAITATSLIFISYDESYGWSDKKLDSACTAFPWFFILGYLIQYCALICKLARIHKVMSLHRRIIKFQQSLLPFLVVISLCIIVLVCWTIFDPLVWERKEISQAPTRLTSFPLETYGKCNSIEKGVLPYIILLGVLIIVATVMTLVLAWKVKDVQSEFAESSWVCYGVFAHLQVWLVGVPLFILLDTLSVDASYLVRLILVFTFSITLVVLVVWPKFGALILEKYGKGGRNQARSSINMTGKRRSNISGFSSSVLMQEQEPPLEYCRRRSEAEEKTENVTTD